MKITPLTVTFEKEWMSRYGMMYAHLITYMVEDELKEAQYNSKFKEQTKFTVGTEVDITEEISSWIDPETKQQIDKLVIKPTKVNKINDNTEIIKGLNTDIQTIIADVKEIKAAVCHANNSK